MMFLLPWALLLLQVAAPAVERAEERTVTVTVADDKGAPIQGLAAEEVAVLENGNAREVRRLELDRRPLTVAILLDSSEPTGTSFRLHVIEAVSQLVNRLPEGSKHSIWTTGDRPRKIVDYTDDPAAASKALRRVFPQGGNTLLDALMEASKDLRSQEGTRNAIVVVTGSGIGFTNYDRRQVVDALEKVPAMVLAVQVDEGRDRAGERSDDPGTIGGVDYDYVLNSLAKSSGGLRETALSFQALPRALQKLATELKAQYRLTYSSMRGSKEPKLEVTVARPGAKVRVGAPRAS
jgi:VWFA-related protein